MPIDFDAYSIEDASSQLVINRDPNDDSANTTPKETLEKPI